LTVAMVRVWPWARAKPVPAAQQIADIAETCLSFMCFLQGDVSRILIVR
jgi:hypothetical protein